jgi:CheY-like chemotaxis protein
LHTFVSPRLPQWIASDPSRLRQVLLNLLGNAVKFTSSEDGHPGQVVLCAEPAMLADGRAGVHLRVSDNGIGMSTETLEKLYQPFTQADESTSRKFGGTGLGLSITQRLVELMGGRISVRSMLGEGSEFIIELPLEETAPGRQIAPDPDLTGVHVLAVTTNVECKEILQSYCRAAGADVAIVTDLAAARSQLRQMQASLGTNVLLLDIDVTAVDESGLLDNVGVVQLVRRGRSIHSDKAVTVLALPLLYHDLIHGVAIASGRLSARVSTALTDRRLQTRNPVPPVEESLAANRLILLAEDNETNREVILEQLHLLGYSAEMAVDGVAALSMWRTGRYALLLTDCHMPNMDGFELTAAIRAEEQPGMHLPIIAVTANALQGEAER